MMLIKRGTFPAKIDQEFTEDIGAKVAKKADRFGVTEISFEISERYTAPKPENTPHYDCWLIDDILDSHFQGYYPGGMQLTADYIATVFGDPTLHYGTVQIRFVSDQSAEFNQAMILWVFSLYDEAVYESYPTWYTYYLPDSLTITPIPQP